MSILELYRNGTLDFLVRTGFLSINKAVQFRYWDDVEANVKKGINKTEAVNMTADIYGVTSQTIWTAIRDIENADGIKLKSLVKDKP